MNRSDTEVHTFADGGDAAVRPVFTVEKRHFGLSAGRWPTIVAPLAIGLLALLVWELVIRLWSIPFYVLPGPTVIVQAMISDWPILSKALGVTLQIALAALLGAVIAGVLLAVLFTQSRWLEMSLFPYAVVLQVTPVVAIAPLIIIWTDNNIPLALFICAWIVAFFPILSNTILGLNSVDHNLINLFQIYGASRSQTLRFLRLPAALPYFLGGLKISGGLALIGAVVAEFVAGTGGSASGLAYTILEAGFQLKIPRMFAALVLISVCGVAIFLMTTWLSNALLGRWHESAVRRET